MDNLSRPVGLQDNLDITRFFSCVINPCRLLINVYSVCSFQKGRAMLHCIKLLTNTCEVKAQVNCYIEETILHYRQTSIVLRMHVHVLNLYIIWHYLSLTTWFWSQYNVSPALLMFRVTHHNAMKRSFYWGGKKTHLWGVYSFNIPY